MKSDFDQAVNFMSAYVSSRHFEAQSKYANRNNGQRRNVSATGSDGDCGGRGRGGRSGQRGGCTAGRGRGGRGRGNGRMKSYINEVNVTDPYRNFTAAEWEKLGTMRGAVLRMREGNGSAGRGGRGGNDSRSPTNNTNRTTSGVSAPKTTTITKPLRRPSSQRLRSAAHRTDAALAAVPTILITDTRQIRISGRHMH